MGQFPFQGSRGKAQQRPAALFDRIFKRLHMWLAWKKFGFRPGAQVGVRKGS